MSQSEKDQKPQTAEGSTTEPLQPKLNRIEEFLKAKASKGQKLGNQDNPGKHGQTQHTKLKERVRRRP